MLFIKYINWVQLVGIQIYNLDIARIKNNTKKWNILWCLRLLFIHVATRMLKSVHRLGQRGRCSNNFVWFVSGSGDLYRLQKVQTTFTTQQTFYAIGAGVSASGVKWQGYEWVGLCLYSSLMPAWCAAGQNYRYLFYLCSKTLFNKMLKLKKNSNCD